MTPAGAFDTRVTFLKRLPIEDRAGNERADEYSPMFTQWAKWRPLSARERTAYGVAEDVTAGELTVRQTANVDTLTNAWRAHFLLSRDEFAVTSLSVKDRSGERKLRLERRMG